jgi:putative protease
MQMAFSRGLYTGWFGGVHNQELVHARYPNKRGVFLGEVVRVLGERVTVRLAGPLKPGDGVVFDAGRPDEREEGGRVYEVTSQKPGVGSRKPEAHRQKTAAGDPPAPESGEVTLSFGNGEVDFSRIRMGDRLWKTSDPALERRIRQTFEGDQIRHQRPVDCEVHGCAGQPLTVIARDEAGHVAQATSAMPLVPAERQPLSAGRLAEQLSRLGGTPFKLGRLDNRIEGAVMLPLSELNRLRRELVAELDRQRTQPRRWTLAGPADSESARRAPAAAAVPAPESELAVMVRSFPQLDAALAAGVTTIYCELEDPKRYRDAVRRHREFRATHSDRPPSSLFVAPPRITKPGEEWILEQVRSCEADGYLIRNHDHLKFFADCRRVGDYSLNVANPLAAEYFVQRFGLERVTASLDLNNAQLEALLQAAPARWIEITIHQHMPMFHMEHCVFCAFLSAGKDYRDCGRPCEKHAVQLRDRVGALHPLKADAGCRNTVYNALPQTGAEYVAKFIGLGGRHFRVEFLDEPAEVVTRTIAAYRGLLRGEVSGAQLWRELKLRHQLGVTRGSLDRGERPITVL